MKRATLAALAMLAFASAAPAQVLFDVGAVVMGGANAGTSTATYIAPDGSLVPQFTLDKSIGAAAGVNGHLSFRFTSRAALELSARWARAEFRTKLGGDTDSAESTTATQSVDRFVVGGGALVDLKQFGRWHTFARASVGWLRELSDDRSLYEDGWVAEIGGGANFRWKEKRGHFRPYGIRTDVWLETRQGGLSFTGKSRLWSPALAVAMIFKL